MIGKALKWLLMLAGVGYAIIIIGWLLATSLPSLFALAERVRSDPFMAAVAWMGIVVIVALLAILFMGSLKTIISRLRAWWWIMLSRRTEGLIMHAGSHVENELFKEGSGTLKNLVEIAGEELPRAPMIYVPAPEGDVKGKDPVWRVKLLEPSVKMLYRGLFLVCVLPRPSGKSTASVREVKGLKSSQSTKYLQHGGERLGEDR